MSTLRNYTVWRLGDKSTAKVIAHRSRNLAATEYAEHNYGPADIADGEMELVVQDPDLETPRHHGELWSVTIDIEIQYSFHSLVNGRHQEEQETRDGAET